MEQLSDAILQLRKDHMHTPEVITFEEQSIEISIPKWITKVGVNCSGGADSAILLFAVAKYMKEHMPDATLSVVTCANALKDRWNARKAADVINYVCEKLEFTQFDMHYAYYRDRQETEYFHQIEKALFDDNRIETLVSGITQKPLERSGDTTIEDVDGKVVNLRDKIIVGRESPDEIIWTPNQRYWNPMANIDKKFVAYLYDYYGVRDELFPMTRSCEAKPDPEVFDPEFEKVACGRCWWCLERKWAFGEY